MWIEGYDSAKGGVFATSPRYDPTNYIGESFDWNYVLSCNIKELKKEKENTKVNALIRFLIHAKVDKDESKVLNHPLCIKLCKLFKYSLLFLQKSNNEYTSKLTKTESQLKVVKKEYRETSKTLKKAEELIQTTLGSWEKCPVCSKKFKSRQYVDIHMQNKHPALLEHCNAIRGIQIPKKTDDIQEILVKINELQENIKQEQAPKQNKPEESTELEQEVETKKTKQKNSRRKQLNDDLDKACDELSSSMILWKEQEKMLNPFHVQDSSPNLSISKPRIFHEDPSPTRNNFIIERSHGIDLAEKKELLISRPAYTNTPFDNSSTVELNIPTKTPPSPLKVSKTENVIDIQAMQTQSIIQEERPLEKRANTQQNLPFYQPNNFEYKEQQNYTYQEDTSESQQMYQPKSRKSPRKSYDTENDSKYIKGDDIFNKKPKSPHVSRTSPRKSYDYDNQLKIEPVTDVTNPIRRARFFLSKEKTPRIDESQISKAVQIINSNLQNNGRTEDLSSDFTKDPEYGILRNYIKSQLEKQIPMKYETPKPQTTSKSSKSPSLSRKSSSSKIQSSKSSRKTSFSKIDSSDNNQEYGNFNPQLILPKNSIDNKESSDSEKSFSYNTESSEVSNAYKQHQAEKLHDDSDDVKIVNPFNSKNIAEHTTTTEFKEPEQNPSKSDKAGDDLVIQTKEVQIPADSGKKSDEKQPERVLPENKSTQNKEVKLSENVSPQNKELPQETKPEIKVKQKPSTNTVIKPEIKNNNDQNQDKSSQIEIKQKEQDEDPPQSQTSTKNSENPKDQDQISAKVPESDKSAAQKATNKGISEENSIQKPITPSPKKVEISPKKTDKKQEPDDYTFDENIDPFKSKPKIANEIEDIKPESSITGSNLLLTITKSPVDSTGMVVDDGIDIQKKSELEFSKKEEENNKSDSFDLDNIENPFASKPKISNDTDLATPTKSKFDDEDDMFAITATPKSKIAIKANPPDNDEIPLPKQELFTNSQEKEEMIDQKPKQNTSKPDSIEERPIKPKSSQINWDDDIKPQQKPKKKVQNRDDDNDDVFKVTSPPKKKITPKKPKSSWADDNDDVFKVDIAPKPKKKATNWDDSSDAFRVAPQTKSPPKKKVTSWDNSSDAFKIDPQPAKKAPAKKKNTSNWDNSSDAFKIDPQPAKKKKFDNNSWDDPSEDAFNPPPPKKKTTLPKKKVQNSWDDDGSIDFDNIVDPFASKPKITSWD